MRNLFPYLVCTGVGIDEALLDEILRNQNPHHQKRGGLGYGLHALVQPTSEIPVSRGVNIRINQSSELYLARAEGENAYSINFGSNTVAVMRPFKPAEWIERKLVNGRYVAEILQQHTASNLVGIIGSTRCALFDSGNACSFCEMKGGDKNVNRTTDEIIEALRIIMAYRKNYVLTFTTPLMNNSEFEEVCRSLKKIHSAFPGISLALESQPAPDYLIDMIKEAGVDTWMVPLDCYSEHAQETYISGKRDVIRNFYWQALPYAVSKFGAGNVVSNLIIGLEHEYYAKAAIYQMIERDVIPDLIPIRPPINFGTKTDPGLFQTMQDYLREQMHTSGLASRMSKVKSGCAACGGCTGGLSANTFKANN